MLLEVGLVLLVVAVGRTAVPALVCLDVLGGSAAVTAVVADVGGGGSTRAAVVTLGNAARSGAADGVDADEFPRGPRVTTNTSTTTATIAAIVPATAKTKR